MFVLLVKIIVFPREAPEMGAFFGGRGNSQNILRIQNILIIQNCQTIQNFQTIQNIQKMRGALTILPTPTRAEFSELSDNSDFFAEMFECFEFSEFSQYSELSDNSDNRFTEVKRQRGLLNCIQYTKYNTLPQ